MATNIQIMPGHHPSEWCFLGSKYRDNWGTENEYRIIYEGKILTPDAFDQMCATVNASSNQALQSNGTKQTTGEVVDWRSWLGLPPAPEQIGDKAASWWDRNKYFLAAGGILLVTVGVLIATKKAAPAIVIKAERE
jgi:hypothetical protein